MKFHIRNLYSKKMFFLTPFHTNEKTKCYTYFEIKYARGFTLVESLVALLVGLILLGGIIQLFLNGKMTYRLNEEMNQMQDNARFISYYLPQMIRQAGYRTLPTNTLYPSFESTFTTPFLSADNNAGINGSDILTIRFQGSGDGLGNPDGKLKDCLQYAVDANEVVTNIFSINNNYELECRSIHTTTNPAIDETAVLAEGVENFQVLFGEDIDNDLSPDRYVPAGFPGLNMNNVTSVRMNILLQTMLEVKPVISVNQYNLLGDNYTPPADKRVRKTFTTTVYLRNRASQSAL